MIFGAYHDKDQILIGYVSGDVTANGYSDNNIIMRW